MSRRHPPRFWIGIVVMLVSQAGMLGRVEPFYSWHTPTAWTGYILFVDGWVWRRRGISWLSDSRAEFLFLALISIPLWVVFEIYNAYFLRNWYYVGLPESLPLRYFGYAWAFATIWPAIFETGDLLASLRERTTAGSGSGAMAGAVSSARATGPDRCVRRQPERLGTAAWTSVIVGSAMLLLPIVYPSPYLAAPVWLGFIFVLDPLNARAGSESILGDWRRGRTTRLVNLLAAGLVCGLLWEFWNYWAGTKWIYTVPILPEIRLFEMPVLGYGGFPAFAVECFTMYVAARRWLWRGAARAISI